MSVSVVYERLSSHLHLRGNDLCWGLGLEACHVITTTEVLQEIGTLSRCIVEFPYFCNVIKTPIKKEIQIEVQVLHWELNGVALYDGLCEESFALRGDQMDSYRCRSCTLTECGNLEVRE